MPSGRTETLCCSDIIILHQLIPLIQSAIGITIRQVVAKAVFLGNTIVALHLGREDESSVVKVLCHPALGAYFHRRVLFAVPYIGHGIITKEYRRVDNGDHLCGIVGTSPGIGVGISGGMIADSCNGRIEDPCIHSGSRIGTAGGQTSLESKGLCCRGGDHIVTNGVRHTGQRVHCYNYRIGSSRATVERWRDGIGYESRRCSYVGQGLGDGRDVSGAKTEDIA